MHIKFNHNNPQTPVDEKEQAENDLDILKKKKVALRAIISFGRNDQLHKYRYGVCGWEEKSLETDGGSQV